MYPKNLIIYQISVSNFDSLNSRDFGDSLQVLRNLTLNRRTFRKLLEVDLRFCGERKRLSAFSRSESVGTSLVSGNLALSRRSDCELERCRLNLASYSSTWIDTWPLLHHVGRGTFLLFNIYIFSYFVHKELFYKFL